MVRRVVCLGFALGALWHVPALPVVAASFDCAKAATPFETAICGDADLSKADERLAKTYATAIGGLSETALGEMRTSQREWLDYAQRACTRDAEVLTAGAYDERGISCLVDVFASRSRVLETSRMMDGLRVYPVGTFGARPDPYEADNPQSNWPVAQHEMAVVQIDADEGFAHAFNDLVRAEGEMISGVFAGQGGPETVFEDDSSDTTNAIEIDEIAGSRRISLVVNTYWYGHGAAHGNYTISFRHYLRDEGRFMEARDLFGGKGWQKALLTLAIDAAKAEHGDALWPDNLEDLMDAVIDPSRWNLSDPYGLVIQFQPYEISAYAYGAPTARVNWEDLEPYLTETADGIRFGY